MIGLDPAQASLEIVGRWPRITGRHCDVWRRFNRVWRRDMEFMFDRRESHAGRGIPASPRQVGKDARRRSHEGEKCKEIKKTKLA